MSKSPRDITAELMELSYVDDIDLEVNGRERNELDIKVNVVDTELTGREIYSEIEERIPLNVELDIFIHKDGE